MLLIPGVVSGAYGIRDIVDVSIEAVRSYFWWKCRRKAKAAVGRMPGGKGVSPRITAGGKRKDRRTQREGDRMRCSGAPTAKGLRSTPGVVVARSAGRQSS